MDHNKPIIVPAGQDSLSQIGESAFTYITSLPPPSENLRSALAGFDGQLRSCTANCILLSCIGNFQHFCKCLGYLFSFFI